MAGVPFKKNEATTIYIPGLISQAVPEVFQVNPTIAAGDFQVSIDGGALNNLATLPVVSPAGDTIVAVALAAVETNGDAITVKWSDVAGGEWCDGGMVIYTSTVQMAEMAAAVLAQIMSVSPLRSSLQREDLDLYRGDTWVQPITGLGDLTGYTEMWITAREDRDDTDAQSAFQVLLSDPPVATDGLQYINGAAGTAANAALTVVSLTGGSVSVRIEAVETAKLTAIGKLKWDFQWTDGTDTETRRVGDLFVTSDVTRVVG